MNEVDFPTVRDAPSSARILLADDEPEIRGVIALVLRNSGFEVDEVSDGREAWDRIQSTSYDIFITDNNMGRLTGLAVIKKIHDSQKCLPVILISGTFPGEALKDEFGLPVSDFLAKPFRAKALLALVRTILDRNARLVSSCSEKTTGLF